MHFVSKLAENKARKHRIFAAGASNRYLCRRQETVPFDCSRNPIRQFTSYHYVHSVILHRACGQVAFSDETRTSGEMLVDAFKPGDVPDVQHVERRRLADRDHPPWERWFGWPSRGLPNRHVGRGA